MAMNLSTEVRMIKGVGPQRAELLAQRGIHTLEDLLGYLPFRYEDRIHFSNVKDIQPNGIYTIRARVMSGQAIRSMRGGRDAIYHLFVLDEQMIDGVAAAAHAANGLAAHHAGANGVDAIGLDVLDVRKMDAVFVAKWQVAEEILER